MPVIPTLEIGGTHLSAAAVDTDTWTLLEPVGRLALPGDVTPEAFLAAAVTAAAAVPAADARWGVAIPDPFDYQRGIALYEGVGKFERLQGLDLSVELRRVLDADSVGFVNDADAFTLGEWVHGAGAGTSRCAGMTLGTGVGSGWVIDGAVVSTGPGVPPGGRAHLLTVAGRPLEEWFSRRAIRAAFLAAGGAESADVKEICQLARSGDARATEVLTAAVTALGVAMGPAVHGFGADVLVVGGSMAGSWDLFSPWFRAGAQIDLPPVRVAADAEAAAHRGAAVRAIRGS